MAAISSFYPQNLSDEAYKNARGALLETLSQILKPSQKSLPKPNLNPPKTLPKPSPNPPKSREIQSAATKTKKVNKK